MKQHLLKFFALLISVFLFTNLNAQVTINYEQEGAGEPYITYYNYDNWTVEKVKLLPGNEYTLNGIGFRNNKVGDTYIQCYKFEVNIETSENLLSVIVDGKENSDYLNAAKAGKQFSIVLTENKEYNINLKLVYEGEYVEKQWTQKLKSSIVGWGGTVKCIYEDKTKGEQTLTLENNGELDLDVKSGEDNKYRMRIVGEPEEGKVVKFITVNGLDVKKSYEENGYYDIVVDNEKATTNLIVEFGDAPRADMVINYSSQGEGTTDYYYFSDAESADKKEGSFVSGENLLNEMYLSDKYCLYVVPKPEEGSHLSEVRVNGNADASKIEQFEQNGYFTIETAIAGEELLLTVIYASEAQKKNVLTVKANPDVNYLIKYSNISAGKQEFYEIKDEDVTIELPDNAYCSWDYTGNPNFIVKGLKINGTTLTDSYFYVNNDMEIELDYIPAAYYSVSLNDFSNGQVTLEKKVFSMEAKDYVYVALAEGEELLAGTGVRVTAYANPGYEIKEFKVNGELKLESTPDNSEYQYSYVADLWENLDIEVTFDLMPSGIDAVSNEPVVMNVYSVDGVLVKTCVAVTVEEAVNDLNDGLYIVNGKKVVVSKSAR